MSKPSCIFMAHRIPYPPDTGEKLRAYNILKGLSSRYNVTLVAAIDRDEDWQHRNAFPDMTCYWTDLRIRSDMVCGVKSLLKRRSITEGYFTDEASKQDLSKIDCRFDLAYVYSSGAAPFLKALKYQPNKVVMDFVDVDSAKWEDLSAQSTLPMNFVYAREGRMLAKYESMIAVEADLNLCVTQDEAAFFKKRTGIFANTSENGVDCKYWKQGLSLASPYLKECPVFVFTGAMDYPPNVQAVLWFVNQVMPLLRQLRPVKFVIAGGRPADAIQSLKRQEDILVTGRVEDMRPWLAHADIAIAPLQIARGVQNKVLEAMASGTPVIASQKAMNGIQAEVDKHLLIANSPEEFVKSIQALLGNKVLSRKIADNAQQHMLRKYDWSARIKELFAMIDDIKPAQNRGIA